jgi:hypothetical protein
MNRIRIREFKQIMDILSFVYELKGTFQEAPQAVLGNPDSI